jgi:hypothetical protein
VALDIGTLLLKRKLITDQQLRAARDVQLRRGGELGRICVDSGYVDERHLAASLAQLTGLPHLDLRRVQVDPEATSKLPRRIAESLCVFPFELRNGGSTLWVAMANPLDEDAKARVKDAAGFPVEFTVAGYREIEAAIQAHYLKEDEFALEDEDEPIKITDLSGNTQVTMRPVEKPGKAAPPVTARADELELTLDEPTDTARTGHTGRRAVLSDADRRLLTMLQEQHAKSSAALQEIMKLCIEAQLFTREQLAKKLSGR